MNETIKKYLDLKEVVKKLSKEIKNSLLENDEYLKLDEEKRASAEVVRSFGKNIIADSVELSRVAEELERKKSELKILKEAILSNVVITDRETGEQLTLPF